MNRQSPSSVFRTSCDRDAIALTPNTRRGLCRAGLARRQSRSGRALTELVLIVMVPCFCLLMWAVFDADFRQSLLAAPQRDAQSFNMVYGLIPIENGTVASLHGQGQIRFWDLGTAAVLGDIQSELVEVRFGAYSKRQRLLAVGSAMGGIEVWDIDHPEQPLARIVDRKRVVMCCQFSPDGNLLICGGDRGALSVWDSRTLQQLDVIVPPGPSAATRSLAISKDGKRALTGLRNGTAQLWDLEKRVSHPSFQVTQKSSLPESTVESIEFLPGDKEFIVATRAEGVIVCNLDSGECVRRCARPLDNIRSGALSPDSSRFVAGNEQGQVAVWDVNSGRLIKEMQQRSAVVRAVICDARATCIVSGDWTGSVQVHVD